MSSQQASLYGKYAEGLPPVWLQHFEQVDSLVDAAIAGFLSACEANPDADVARLYQVTAKQFSQAAAVSALQALEASRREAGTWGLLDKPRLALEYTDRQLLYAGKRIAAVMEANPTGFVSEVEKMMTGTVMGATRRTVFDASVTSGCGWQRIPKPGACWFCLMLASRTAVYSSKSAALYAAGNRGNQKEGERFHNYCRCQAIPVSDVSQLPNAILDLQEEYQKVAGVALHDDLTPEMAREKWKEHILRTRGNPPHVKLA